MNTIDIILLIPLLYGLYSGYNKGLIGQLVSLFGFVISVYVALRFSNYLAEVLNEIGYNGQFLGGAAAILVTFLLAYIFLRVTAATMNKALKTVGIGLVNRLVGAFLGLMKFFIITSFLVFIFQKLIVNLLGMMEEPDQSAWIYHYMIEAFSWIFGEISTFLNRA